MIRNLKVLGLALAAVFAFSAALASAASAADVTSDGPVTLTGSEVGGTANNFLSAFGAKVTCGGSTYKGHKYNVTPHAFLEEHFSTVTVTPSYDTQAGCLAAGALPATVHMNGCDFVLHVGGSLGSDEYAVTSDLICPQGSDVTVTIFRNATEHAGGSAFCTMHIKAQTGLTGARLVDQTNGHLLLKGEVENIHIVGTDPEKALLCPVTGTEQTVTNGKLKLEVTISGDNEAGGSTSLSIS